MASRETAGGTDIEHEQLLIPVRGETVAATRFRARGDGSRPTLLMYTPYHNDDWITFGAYYPTCEYLARSGYDVVAADMVGTGASSGKIEEMFPQREGKEAAAIVEWLADREWSTGRVGMFGKSYGGTSSLYAAAYQPDALDAIVPIMAPHQGYKNGYVTPGAMEFYGIGGEWLPQMQLLDAKPPSLRDADGRWAEVWAERLETVQERDPWMFQFLDHETKDDYWADKDVPLDRIETPTFAVAGYRDGPYTQEMLEVFEAVDAPKRLLMGPWRHVMPHRGREVAIDFRQQVVEWFDRFLKDEDNGALDRPTVTYWTERDGGGKVDGGVWRGRDDWPTYRESDPDDLVSFALTGDGLTPESTFEDGAVADEYEYDQTVGIDSAEELITAEDAKPVDTGQDDLRSLTYETDALERPVELTGIGAATLRVRPTTADPHVTVRVVDVSPAGDARLVAYGHRRLRYRAGATDPREVVPGEEYEVSIPLKPKSHVFEAGHRIRVAISAAYFPLVMPTRGHGAFTVSSSPDAPSVLRFPGTEHDDASFEAVSMGDPDESVPLHSTYVTDSTTRWETTRERFQDSATVRTYAASTIDLPHAEMETAQEITVSVDADEPESTVLRSEPRVTIEYGHETVEVAATSRVTLNTTTLHTTVTIDGEVHFEENWSR